MMRIQLFKNGRAWLVIGGPLVLAAAVMTSIAADDHDHANPATRPASVDKHDHHDDDHDHSKPATRSTSADKHDDHDHDHAKPATRPTAAEKHDHDHDDHDHSKPAAGDPQSAKKHDHAHGHGEAEGHVDEVKLTPEAIKKYDIRTEPTTRRSLRPTFVAPARLAFNGNAMAHVGSAVKGRVAELKAQVGDPVKKDEVLLVVESPELGEAQSDFVQKRAAFNAASPLLESAKSGFERAKDLFDKSQGISLNELQKREIDFRSAQAALQTAQTAATAAENRLRLFGMTQEAVDALAKSGQINPKYEVRAPITGHVTEREVTLGELVSPEREHLLIIADMSRLWAQADVPEVRLKGLTKGAEAKLTLAAMPDEKVAGKVAFVAQTIDAATRTVKVRIDVDNEDGTLMPGMFAAAEIAIGVAQTQTLAVPDSAVQTVEGGPAVFVPVEGEPNTYAKRSITVGKTVGGWTPVLSGLKEGEAVVVSGSFILKADLGKAGAAHEH